MRKDICVLAITSTLLLALENFNAVPPNIYVRNVRSNCPPRVSGAASLARNNLTGAWSVDGMESRFNRMAVMTPELDTEALIKVPLKNMTCLENGKRPFLMHGTGIESWVCRNIGERRVAKIMLHVLNMHVLSSDSDSPRGLMLDVGANAGFYGLLALQMGIEALFFDLQPGCQKLLNNAIIVNGFLPTGRVVPYGVSSHSDSFKMHNNGGCDGRFPATEHEFRRFDTGETVVRLDTLDTFVDMGQSILLMKVDTEGNEQKVLAGAMPFFQQHLIHSSIVEVTPATRFWKNVNVTRRQVAETFKSIAEYGYTMVSLFDWSVHSNPESVFHYIINATFPQSDMWLTLDSVNKTHVGEHAFTFE